MSIPIFSLHESGYHDCPMDTHKAGEVLAALVERYGVEELTDLSRRSGIPRTTLQNWQDRPDTAVRSAGAGSCWPSSGRTSTSAAGSCVWRI